MRYEAEKKELILKKLLNPGGPTVRSVCDEYGVSQSVVYRWLQAARNGSMSRRSRKRNISLSEKQKLLLEAGKLSEPDLGLWLREHGLHSGTLEQWQSEVERALVSFEKPVQDQSAKEIKELQKELHRKDKALAEVSALLVLKKKLAVILGEDSEP